MNEEEWNYEEWSRGRKGKVRSVGAKADRLDEEDAYTTSSIRCGTERIVTDEVLAAGEQCGEKCVCCRTTWVQ